MNSNKFKKPNFNNNNNNLMKTFKKIFNNKILMKMT